MHANVGPTNYRILACMLLSHRGRTQPSEFLPPPHAASWPGGRTHLSIRFCLVASMLTCRHKLRRQVVFFGNLSKRWSFFSIQWHMWSFLPKIWSRPGACSSNRTCRIRLPRQGLIASARRDSRSARRDSTHASLQSNLSYPADGNSTNRIRRLKRCPSFVISYKLMLLLK
jgi:hypothetical protein